MRILGFSKKWPKLQEPEFTTFRFTRRDKDWQVDELAQIVFQPRRKGGGEKLGVAEIVGKEPRWIFTAKKPRGQKVVTPREAHADGFKSYVDMAMWLVRAHGHQSLVDEPMNKLTLRWVNG
ncbi:hypothetical protein ES703_59561 [subsurface metagenome]